VNKHASLVKAGTTALEQISNKKNNLQFTVYGLKQAYAY